MPQGKGILLDPPCTEMVFAVRFNLKQLSDPDEQIEFARAPAFG